MIRVVAKFELKDGALDEAKTIAQELIGLTRQEAGCVQYHLAQSTQNPNSVVVLEAWESQRALGAHAQSEHYQRLVPALAALCTSAPAVDVYEELI